MTLSFWPYQMGFELSTREAEERTGIKAWKIRKLISDGAISAELTTKGYMINAHSLGKYLKLVNT